MAGIPAKYIFVQPDLLCPAHSDILMECEFVDCKFMDLPGVEIPYKQLANILGVIFT